MNVLSMNRRRNASEWLIVPLALVLSFSSLLLAADKVSPDAKHQVQSFGTGHTVKVTLKNGTVVQGKLTEIDDTSFSLDEGKKKGVSTLSYADVASVQHGGLSTGAKVGIGAGAVAAGSAAAWGIYALAYSNSVSSPPCFNGSASASCPPIAGVRKAVR
jgi:hypothetical protein